MATQSLNGAGFEYACAAGLLRRYTAKGRLLVVEPASIPRYYARQHKFEEVKPEIQAAMLKSAAALARHVTSDSQRWVKGLFDLSNKYQMRIGDDARNMDVRDLVIYGERGVELGISLKWNSDEIKSLRLGDTWFRQFHIADDQRWLDAITPHHNLLERFDLWRDAIAELGREKVYGPYKQAIIAQLEKGMANPSTVNALAEFMFGRQSYLKAMAIAKGKELSLAYYDTKNLPTRLIEVSPSSKGFGYIDVVFNHGWQLLMRLHNKDKEIPHGKIGSGMSVTVTVTGWGEKSGQRCWRIDD